MSRKVIIGGTILAAVIGIGAAVINKVKKGVEKIDLNVSFLRVHGLVGTIFNPGLQVVFNLNVKNFSGLDIEVRDVYTRIETAKAGSNEWSTVATQADYVNVAVINGKTSNLAIVIEFKGLPLLKSFIDKTNRHRAVVSYSFKGIGGEYVKDLDLNGAIAPYVATLKSKLGLSGVAPKETYNLIA